MGGLGGGTVQDADGLKHVNYVVLTFTRRALYPETCCAKHGRYSSIWSVDLSQVTCPCRNKVTTVRCNSQNRIVQ